MNYRLLTLLIVILGYVTDAVMTFYFVIYLKTYSDAHSINETVYGLLYTHLSVIILVFLLAFLLWIAERKLHLSTQLYYVVMSIAGLCLWSPVIVNIIALS